jgi:hypothetical protein
MNRVLLSAVVILLLGVSSFAALNDEPIRTSVIPRKDQRTWSSSFILRSGQDVVIAIRDENNGVLESVVLPVSGSVPLGKKVSVNILLTGIVEDE